MNFLPNEIIATILPFLDTVTLARSGQVCRQWYPFSQSEELWEEVILNEIREKKYLVFGPKEWETHHKITTSVKYPRHLCATLAKIKEPSFAQCKIKEVQNCKELADLTKKKEIGYLQNEIKGIELEKEVAGGDEEWFIALINMIPKSTKKKLTDQTVLAKKKEPSCRASTIFEISLIAFNLFITAGEVLLANNKRRLFTRCISTSNSDGFIATYLKRELYVMKYDQENQQNNTGLICIKPLEPV